MANDDESLPFDVLLERVPTWAVGSSCLVIVAAVLTATGILPPLALLAALLPSAVARRFTTTEAHVVVDADGLTIGDKLAFSRAEILDVWFDQAEESDARAVVSDERRSLALYFPNREQAKRFADALAPSGPHPRVAGNLPELRDWAAPLRFVAVALVAFGNNRASTMWIVAFILVLALPGLFALASAQRVIVRGDAAEVRTLVSRRAVPLADVRVPSFRRRDATFQSPKWLERLFDRALTKART